MGIEADPQRLLPIRQPPRWLWDFLLFRDAYGGLGQHAVAPHRFRLGRTLNHGSAAEFVLLESFNQLLPINRLADRSPKGTCFV